jgi:hypothetical protein
MSSIFFLPAHLAATGDLRLGHRQIQQRRGAFRQLRHGAGALETNVKITLW